MARVLTPVCPIRGGSRTLHYITCVFTLVRILQRLKVHYIFCVLTLTPVVLISGGSRWSSSEIPNSIAKVFLNLFTSLGGSGHQL